MPKFFVKQEQIQENKIIILGQDVNHIKKVLRAKVEEEIQICNSQSGENYTCVIEKINDKDIVCNIKEKIQNSVESNIEVTIFQGLPKADKMEYIIQKSVELGVFDITPVEMKRCVVKINEKDKEKKLIRWRKISEVAAKQCGRDLIPEINNIVNIKELNIESYDVFLVAYENEEKNTLKEQLKVLKAKYREKDKKIKIGVLIRTRRWTRKSRCRKFRRKRRKNNNIRKKNFKNRNSSVKCLEYNYV